MNFFECDNATQSFKWSSSYKLNFLNVLLFPIFVRSSRQAIFSFSQVANSLNAQVAII